MKIFDRCAFWTLRMWATFPKNRSKIEELLEIKPISSDSSGVLLGDLPWVSNPSEVIGSESSMMLDLRISGPREAYASFIIINLSISSFCSSSPSPSGSLLAIFLDATRSPSPSSILSRKLRLNSPISFCSPSISGYPKSSTSALSTSLGSVYFFWSSDIFENKWASLLAKVLQAVWRKRLLELTDVDLF